MSDVFREVDEDLRRDRLLALWKRFGPYVIGAAVVLVLVVAGRAYWIDYIDSKRQAESRAYEEALAAFQSDAEKGRGALEQIVTGSNDGYSAIAQFQLAAQLQHSGQIEQATALYETIAADGDLNERLRGLASLMAATLFIDDEREIEAREILIGLVANNSSWKLSATEFLGFLDFQAGNLEQAKSVFISLSLDQDAPQAMQARAREMLSLLEVSGQKQEADVEPDGSEEEDS